MNVYEQECDSQELEYWHDEDDYQALDEQWKEKYHKSQRELKALQDKLGMIKNIVEGIPNYRPPFADPRQAALGMNALEQRLSGYQPQSSNPFGWLFGG